MHEHENVDVVKDAYLAFSEGNFDVLLECLSEDVKWFAIGPPDLIPTAGTRYGPEQVEQYFSLLEANGDLRKLRPVEFIAQDDKVVAIGDMQADVKATGRSIRSPWVHVFTLHHGKITQFRSFYDTAAMVSVLENQMQARPRRRTSELNSPAIF